MSSLLGQHLVRASVQWVLRWNGSPTSDVLYTWLASIKAAAGLAATSAYVIGRVDGISKFSIFSRKCSAGGSALWMKYARRDSVVPNINSVEEMALSSFGADHSPRSY